MRKLKHLIWIIPALVLIAISIGLYNSSQLRTAEEAYHAQLPSVLKLTSSSFTADGEIPTAYTCEGKEISPHLAWTGAPAGTKSFAIIITDRDAPSPSLRLMEIVHWALYNIPAEQTSLAESANIAVISATKNFSGDTQFVGPCPPMGKHAYTFRVYALDTERLNLPSNEKASLLKAMQTHILGYGTLTAYRTSH